MITTKQASIQLNITQQRVRMLIKAGKLKAKQYDKTWIIDKESLNNYKPGKIGRPKKD